MTHVSGEVVIRAAPAVVYRALADGVRAHTVGPPGEWPDAPVTVLTRYTTRLWFGVVETTEEATLEPGRSFRWRHVDGPLTGSVETFRVGAHRDGGAVISYEGEIHARHPLFRGPLEALFVAPTTRRVSMSALRSLRRELERP